jgi:hypothetical protein
MMKPHRHVVRGLALATATLCLVTTAAARAQGGRSDVPPPAEQRPTEAGPAPVRLGATAGVGFPRPFSGEAILSIGGWVDLGAEYGFLPTENFGGVNTSLWSVGGELRVHPFRGAFFLGAVVGRQHIRGATTVAASGLTASEQLDLDAWFVNPRIGFLWTTSFGLAIGIDAGVQVPFRLKVASTLPLSLDPTLDARVNQLGNMVLPTIDLLRIGLML